MSWRRVTSRTGLLTSILVGTALSVVGAASPAAAAATPSLSSVIVPDALPGMVEAPPGPVNGPLSASELRTALSEVNASPEVTGDVQFFEQAITDGRLKAYLRMWTNEPPDGTYAEVIAIRLPSADDASQFLAGADAGVKSQQLRGFAVPGVPHAFGASAIVDTKLGQVNEDVVQFAKGPIMFDVIIGQLLTPGNRGVAPLSDGQAIQIAQHQAAYASGGAIVPFTPSDGSNTAYVVGGLVGAAVMIAMIIWLVLYLVRRNGSPTAGLAFPGMAWDPPSAGTPTGPGFPPPSGHPVQTTGTGGPVSRQSTAVLERPRAGKHGFYCSWCGDLVAIGAQISHDCGPRDRPTLYCMNCGTTFDGATVCPSCGNRKLQ